MKTMRTIKAKDLKPGHRIMLVRDSFIVVVRVDHIILVPNGALHIWVSAKTETGLKIWEVDGFLSLEDEIMLVPDSTELASSE